MTRGTGSPEGLHTGRIVPVYERTGSVTTNMQRRFVWQALAMLPTPLFDPVPEELLAAHALAGAPRRAVRRAFPAADAWTSRR